MRSIIQGNEDAFTQLSEKYRRPLTIFIRKRLGRTLLSGCEDVLQITMTKVWYHRQKFDLTYDRVDCWLFAIAKQACVDYWRSVQKHCSEIPINETNVISIENVRPRPDIVAVTRLDVEACLERLTDEEQKLIILKHFEGLTGEEISQQLQITPSCGRVRLLRAVSKLKGLINRITQ